MTYEDRNENKTSISYMYGKTSASSYVVFSIATLLHTPKSN